MNFNEALRKLREAVGESQQAFSTRLGISIRGLANYEGDRTPTLPILAKLHQIALDRRDALSRGVYQALTQEFVAARAAALPERTNAVSYGVTRDGERGGLLYQTLDDVDDYRFAAAFQRALRLRRQAGEVGAAATRALEQFYDAILPLLKTGEAKNLELARKRFEQEERS